MPKASVDAAEEATSAVLEKAALACFRPLVKTSASVLVELKNERHHFFAVVMWLWLAILDGYPSDASPWSVYVLVP